MLDRVIYAGYIEHEPWGVTRRKGHHEPIISLETFHKIQERKRGRALAPRRKDISEDFPLRGVVLCACCNQPLTACWSKSKTGKRYPYFWCKTRGCPEHRKNIRAEKIDAEFEAIMRDMTPSEVLLETAIAMLKDAAGQLAAQSKHSKSSIKRQIANLDKQQDSVIERLTETTNAKVATALESKIEKLENDKLVLKEKLAQTPKSKAIGKREFELLARFLSNP